MPTIDRVNGSTNVHSTDSTTGPSSPASEAEESLLPEPSGAMSEDAFANLAALLTRADQADAKDASSLQQVADQAATQEDDERVAKMREKADKDEAQGVWAGIGDIAGGLAALGGAFVTRDPAGQIDWRNGLANGVKPVLSGSGAVIAGVYKGEADRSDADAAQAEARSQADVRRSQQMQQRATDANNSIQKVEQFLEQIQQTKNATRLAAATRA